MMRKIYLLVVIILFIGGGRAVMAQKPSATFSAAYRVAKQLLQEKKYGLAMESFKSLLADNPSNDYTPYANYFLGYSAYHNGDISYAKNVFLQLTLTYQNWAKLDAAYLWLSYIGYQQSGAFQSLLYASKIKTEPYLSQSNAFLKTKLAHENPQVLKQLNQTYPQHRQVAESYAYALNQQTPTLQNTTLLDSIISVYQLERSQFNALPKSEHKPHYTLGVLLPLFIDKMEASGKYLTKTLAIDLYEGAQMAAFDVDSTLFSLKVFDTRMDSAELSHLYKQGALQGLDAVLGPIYPKPVARMHEISIEDKLIFLHPTSSSKRILKNNPYAFLARAEATQLAGKAAQYMEGHARNKNALIYYGSSTTDSIAAYTYKQLMEADSFHIIFTKKVGKENRREVYDGLTKAVQVIDRSRIRGMTREQIRNSLNLPMRDSLLIPPDSVGHIFIASSDPTLATEVMSAIITRGDSIQLMGIGNWFELENANFGIMEGLGVTLAISALDDVATLEYQQLTKRYIQKYHTKPGKYFFRGYFGMKALAESLKTYGTYFMNGYRKQGNFNPMFDFQNSHSNGAIKIITIENHQIKTIPISENSIAPSED